ncbi:OLC1v1014966C1 [Oldenlandia corymbosa var. corymbosa]|uniref:OLC1v1014966C1 n=1 Tax=Oldenlandia corymbosa var. corymbosa TaxID=529605 RepID=A0AAV1E5V0_OLDCO|nr:OLC1v1014966C1 [Oldenlandia corymbosa var. corymbosa]
MGSWNLDLTIISATNLEDVRGISCGREMKVYAEVSINGEPGLMVKTRADRAGRTSPQWNAKISYVLTEQNVLPDTLIVIKLYCKRSFSRDTYVGQVNLSLKQLFGNRNIADDVVPKCEEHEVIRVNDKGGDFGVLKISHRLYEHVVDHTCCCCKGSKGENGNISGCDHQGSENSGSCCGLLVKVTAIMLREVAIAVAESLIF